MNKQVKELIVATLISILLLGAVAFILTSFAEGAENERHIVRQH